MEGLYFIFKCLKIYIYQQDSKASIDIFLKSWVFSPNPEPAFWIDLTWVQEQGYFAGRCKPHHGSPFCRTPDLWPDSSFLKGSAILLIPAVLQLMGCILFPFPCSRISGFVESKALPKGGVSLCSLEKDWSIHGWSFVLCGENIMLFLENEKMNSPDAQTGCFQGHRSARPRG